MLLAKILLAMMLALAHLSPAAAEVICRDYEGFTIRLDCERRSASKFRYNAQRDQGDFKRHKRFYLDPDARYNRGHLVPANHLDNDAKAIKQSNYMTNILPQASNMNRGAWLRTEELIECYRDIDELLILGGVIWGDDTTDDYFVASHGVTTPEAFWKLIIRGQDRVIAWIVPNTQAATRKRLDDYLVTVEELEQRTGESFPEVPTFRRAEKPEVSWIVPIGCDKS